MGELEIVNLALSLLGQASIQSMSEGSAAANAAKLNYDSVRRATLREYNWSFALSTARLARVEWNDGDFEFSFSLPADCLKVLRLLEEGSGQFRADERDAVPYRIRGNVLSCNVELPMIEYVRNVENPAEFDDLFIDAFKYKLAGALAMPVTGNASLMQGMLQMGKSFLAEAAGTSGREQRDPGVANRYVDARG